MARQKIRKRAHAFAKRLEVTLPGRNLPIEIKLIALFVATGGLSLMGGVFGDVIRPTGTHLPTYLIRLVVGVSMITISYGIVTRKRWSLLLYGAVIAAGLYLNFVAALIPLAALIYLLIRFNLFS